MKILFLTDNFPPESNAPANRTYEHALEWLNKGAAVTVITCAPNFPNGKVYKGYQNKLYQTEDWQGIKVIRVWSYMASNSGILRRTLDYISFGFMAFFASLWIKTDVIVATTPQFFTAVFGYFSAFFKRKPWIMEVRDLWPESIKAVEAIRHPKIIHYLEKLELFLYRKATKIIVVTNAFKEDISKRGIPKSKIEVIKNGVVLNNYPVLEKSNALLQELNLEGKFIVGYMGTHGLAHKLDFILNCCKVITDPDIHFVFVGDGAKKPELLAQKNELQLSNVTFLPAIPKAEVSQYISIFDIALVPLRKNETFKTVIPSKIFENAAMGKPILLGLEGECKQLIQKYSAGLCFKPENEADFLKQLSRLKNDPVVYKNCRAGALKMADSFNRHRFAENMLQIIKKVAFPIDGMAKNKLKEAEIG